MHAFVFLRFTGAGGDAERYPRWCRSLARGAPGWSDLGGHPPESPGSKLMASYKEATRDTCYLNPCHNPAKELITRPRLHYQYGGGGGTPNRLSSCLYKSILAELSVQCLVPLSTKSCAVNVFQKRVWGCDCLPSGLPVRLRMMPLRIILYQL